MRPNVKKNIQKVTNETASKQFKDYSHLSKARSNKLITVNCVLFLICGI